MIQTETPEIGPNRRKYDTLDWIVLGLVALAAFIRFAKLGDLVFYWDEPLHTVRIAAQPLWFGLTYPNGSALFTILVHFLLGLGDIEFMARFPSAVFGHISILIIYRLGKLLLSRAAGVLAALFMALSPTLIQYSQYSRMYGTYSFFSLLSIYFFYRAITENKAGGWIGYTASTTAHIYNHVMGFFVLPVYGIFAIGNWFSERFVQGKNKIKPPHSQTVVRFTLWTLLLLLIVTLLYLPAQTLRNYLFSSVNRAADVSASPAKFGAIKDILGQQLQAKNIYIFWSIIGLSLLGIAFSVKERLRETLLLLIYFFIPFFIFILVRPNAVTFQSANRYFIFFLPVIFLFMGEAIWRVIHRLTRLAAGKTIPRAISDLSAFIWAFALGLIIALFCFNLNSYYRDYWRLGAYHTPPPVMNFLEKNLKKESLILLDDYPASAMTTIAAPITKDLAKEDLELIFRKSPRIKAERNRILLYRIELAALQLYANLDIPVCAAVRTAQGQRAALMERLDKVSNVIVNEENSHWSFLIYPEDGTPLFRKIITLLEARLSLNPPPWRARQIYWMLARANLFGGYDQMAVENIRAAQSLKMGKDADVAVHTPVLFHLFDTLGGLNPRKLMKAAEELYLVEETAVLLFRNSNRLAAQGELEKALRGFSTCAEISTQLKDRAQKRLGDLALRFFSLGDMENVIGAFKKTGPSPLPDPLDRFLYIEALSRSGRSAEAKEKIAEYFPLSPRPGMEEKILSFQPALFLWQEGKRIYLIFRAPKGVLVEGRIEGGKGLKDTESRWLRPGNEFHAEDGTIEFSFRMDWRRIKSLAFPASRDRTIGIEFSIDGQKLPESLVLINIRDGSLKVLN